MRFKVYDVSLDINRTPWTNNVQVTNRDGFHAVFEVYPKSIKLKSGTLDGKLRAKLEEIIRQYFPPLKAMRTNPRRDP